jgi:Kdo2-lipid A phosphotransferase
MKLLLFAFVGAALLLFSFFWPPSHLLWERLDYALFAHLNGSLEGRPLWHAFWASILSFRGDLLLCLLLVGLAAAYLFSGDARGRLTTLLWVAGFGLVGLLTIKKLLLFPRASPALALPGAIRTDGDAALYSFPSDHTVALLYATLFFFSFGRVWHGVVSMTTLALYSSARLITGAHWLSDMAVGSVATVLLLFSIAVLSRFAYIARQVSDSQPSAVTTNVSSSRTPPSSGR